MKNKTISWDCSKKDSKTITQITRRVLNNYRSLDVINVEMDITAVHCNGNPLDLEKLLAADEFNFRHDIIGIITHINRRTGKLKDCFVPRCSQ